MTEAETFPCRSQDTANGTTYQYATVAALALRYYGIPARYVEGYTVNAKAGEETSVDAKSAGAWVEVYQDGAGWLPLRLTPGLEDLSAEQTESGVKPVGAGKEGTGDGLRVTEGQELEQNDAEPDNSEDNSPEGGETNRTSQEAAVLGHPHRGLAASLDCGHRGPARASFSKSGTRPSGFTQDDSERRRRRACLRTAAIAARWRWALKRGNGSMLELCEGVENRFGAENADKLREMTLLNARALFSTKALTKDERMRMESFRADVLNLLKTHTKWPKKLRLKWLSCLY